MPQPAACLAALSDYLSTPQAFFVLSELAAASVVREAELAGTEAPFSDVDDDPLLTEQAYNAAAELKASLLFLGFGFSEASMSEAAIDEVIRKRLDFIRQKNWAEADRIRDELLAQGIQLKDGKDPATGERVTTWEVKR